ncbi:MAG: poly(3-hydroxybutyrate) depolymerase, partial [Pseudomonadota bacterium]
YGKRKPPAKKALGEMIRFYQADFIGFAQDRACMAEFGYAYIPSKVKKSGKAIGVHIALHGCKQGYAFVDFVNGLEATQAQPPYGDRYITTTGYIEWAEANDLIVLFPQADGGDSNAVQNPDGCWDWWGYSAADLAEPDYYTQDAVQIKAIHSMLEELTNAV